MIGCLAPIDQTMRSVVTRRLVEGLSHRDENRAGRLKPFDELRKVGEGTDQPVDLVDHDLLDETGIDVVEQALQARALQGSSRAPRVLVDGWQQRPALRLLARDIRGAGFSLRIEGVELLFETPSCAKTRPF